jgi:predicted PurR-regulated permease PerM
MQAQNEAGRAMTSGEFKDAMIRLGLIAVIAVLCLRVFSPFMGLMVWALILAITLYPLHQRLARRLAGNQGRAATLMVLVGVLSMGIPFFMLSESFVSFILELVTAYKEQTLVIPLPKASVAEWPVVGNKVYDLWHAAATNLPDFLEENKTAVEGIGKHVVGWTVSTASGVVFVHRRIDRSRNHDGLGPVRQRCLATDYLPSCGR